MLWKGLNVDDHRTSPSILSKLEVVFYIFNLSDSACVTGQ